MQNDVDAYLASLTPPARRAVLHARRLIHGAVPGLEEFISYQILAFRKEGRVLFYLAGWKDHVSLYPASDALLAAVGDVVAPHVHGRGTLRFPLSEPLPEKLWKSLLHARAGELADELRARAAQAAAKKTAPKKQTAPKKRNATAKKPAKKKTAPKKTATKKTAPKKTAKTQKTASKKKSAASR